MDSKVGNHREQSFIPIQVWKRLNGEMFRCYRCFQVFPAGGYCVQSADSYTIPRDEARERRFDQQCIELFLEQSPVERSGLYSSLEAAIEAFDAEFA